MECFTDASEFGLPGNIAGEGFHTFTESVPEKNFRAAHRN